VIAIAEEVEKRLGNIEPKAGAPPQVVAVMGCAVNGPGEAREADIGLAGGDGCALLFKRGEPLRKVPEDQAVDALLDEIERL
jgi:(E)-4-hydroxy-3-methylbut-2-enyl-diphosphate synthase